MNWFILIVAGLFEVVWATALKMSNGFRNPLADAVFVVGMALSVWLLAVAMKTIPMGTAYAVWTGIGAIGGVAVGIIAFGESASVLRIVSAALIVAGIVGLKLAGRETVANTTDRTQNTAKAAIGDQAVKGFFVFVAHQFLYVHVYASFTGFFFIIHK